MPAFASDQEKTITHKRLRKVKLMEQSKMPCKFLATPVDTLTAGR